MTSPYLSEHCTSNRMQSIKWKYPIWPERYPGHRVHRLLPTASFSESFPHVIWQPISISSVAGKKKKMGHCTVTKKTFTENTAIKKSLSSTGLKCPKEARICRAWVPGADRLTKQHKLRHQPTRDTFQNSIRQKEIGRIHWWRGREACGGRKGCFLHYQH